MFVLSVLQKKILQKLNLYQKYKDLVSGNLGSEQKKTDLKKLLQLAKIELKSKFPDKISLKNDKKYRSCGVRLKSQKEYLADIICSNSDYAHTYLKLIKKGKFWHSDLRTQKLSTYSNSLVVIYFGFKKLEDKKLDLAETIRHHNIILGSLDYLKEYKNIYQNGNLTEKFSQYLHIPTVTDSTLAPQGYHTAYTLVCVPNKKLFTENWAEIGEEFTDKVLDFLDINGYIPDLKKRLVHKSFITPDYFENDLNSYLGNSFGLAPIFRQSALFRPHNRSEDIENLYLVGASYQPGAGTPSVMMSAKMTTKLIAEDFGILA
jgi:phytoene desaturase